MRVVRGVWLLVAALLLAFVPHSARADWRIDFGPSIVAIPGGKSTLMGEPRLLVDPDEKIFVAAHFVPTDCETGKRTTRGRSCVFVSDDRGRSFHISGAGQDPAGDDVDLALTFSGTLLESTMTNAHEEAGGYEAGLGSGVLGTTVSRSADGGRHWSDSMDANFQVLNDRPFLLADRDTVLITFTAPPGNIFASRSTDQGAVFGPPLPVTPTPPNPALSLNGAPSLDRDRGDLIVPYAWSSSGTCLSGPGGCFDRVGIARSHDHGVSWTTEAVTSLSERSGITAVIGSAADDAGHEYVVYGSVDHGTGVDAVFLTRNDRRGEPWTPPLRVDVNGGSAMLPAVVAAGKGGVAVAYYRASVPDAETHASAWSIEAAISSDGGRTFLRRPVSDGTDYVGTGRDHQPAVWDLFGLALDGYHRLHVAWTRVGAGSREIRYTRQVAGPLLGS
jgi:hypothetical protein